MGDQSYWNASQEPMLKVMLVLRTKSIITGVRCSKRPSCPYAMIDARDVEVINCSKEGSIAAPHVGRTLCSPGSRAHVECDAFREHLLSSSKIADSTAILPDQHQAKIVRCKYPFIDVLLDEVASRVDIEAKVLGARYDIRRMSWRSGRGDDCHHCARPNFRFVVPFGSFMPSGSLLSVKISPTRRW